MNKDKNKLTWVKLGISFSALLLIVVHILWKEIAIDSITLGLLILLLLPWLSELFESIELPGGWKFEFRKEMEKQKTDLNWVKSLATLLISDYEKKHLDYFNSNEPFEAEVEQGGNFEWELRHLIALNFIDRQPKKGLRQIFGAGKVNLKEYFFITERGKKYLDVLKESTEQPPASSK